MYKRQFVSRPILEKARKAYPATFNNNVRVIWNGISFPEESEKMKLNQKSQNIVFCMCRLVERKNLVRAIQAIAKVNNDGISCEFYIAGSGEEAEKVLQEILACDAADYITYLGRISDEEAVEFYQKSAIFLHPQVVASEGKDLSLIHI